MQTSAQGRAVRSKTDSSASAEKAEEEMARRRVLSAQAERRRNLLRDEFRQARLTVAEATRRAGMTHGNHVYNYLRGHTLSLSSDTVFQLGRILPRVPAIFLGEEASLKGLQVTMMATEAAQQSADLEKPLLVGMPTAPEWHLEGVFGVVVRNPGAEEIYPDGTMLACVPIKGHLKHLQPARRVVLVKRRIGKEGPVWVTIRELVRITSRLKLLVRSSRPTAGNEMIPPGFKGGGWTAGNDSYEIAGLVMMACIKEGE